MARVRVTFGLSEGLRGRLESDLAMSGHTTSVAEGIGGDQDGGYVAADFASAR